MRVFESFKLWWKEDVYRRWLLVSGFVFAYFFGQGIPLWDDDFTSWFWKIKDKSILQTLLEIISPISTQPQYWGFNERPIQALIYQVCHLISGYESWSYFIYKSLIYSGVGVMIYQWGLRLVQDNGPDSRQEGRPLGGRRKFAAFAAAVFFLVAPGPVAAHILHQDLATTAEFLFLLLTYFIWAEVERTPEKWVTLPDPRKDQQRAWLTRWVVLSILTYIGYKSKADLKLIPGILALYILLVRRHQWKLFALPIALMGLLAVPWGGVIFHKLPPFVPGSRGSDIGWMWQPANLDRLKDFLWSSGPYDWGLALKAPTLSLAGLLGPYLLTGMVVFLAWSVEMRKSQGDCNWNWKTLSMRKRALVFVLIWTGAIVAALSALPALNYTFRIRYGILPLVPVSLLLAWVFGFFSDFSKQVPKWVVAAAISLLLFQTGINLNRSVHYRRDMGQVMVSVDQVYEYFAKTSPNAKLALFPDFRPYDYRPDAPETFLHKEVLQRPEDLSKGHEPYQTYAISWSPSLWSQVELVQRFSGCRDTSIFDHIFPCASGSGAFLMRYIGADQLYDQGETLRQKGDIAGAMKLHEAFVFKHPDSLAGLFVVGLEAYQLGNWNRAAQVYSILETALPDHPSILYNHALALRRLEDYKPAIERLRYVYDREPRNQAAASNLYACYLHAGETRRAQEVLRALSAVRGK
ncbi:MAG: tetratricopeptide repeat protein [Oligoflexia bacterium]|nr:tetratricopeptide repeat protein [Oligoflexia bacterium]